MKAVIWHFVPFFAGDLARFATNAYSRISEETDFDVFLHVIVPTLIVLCVPSPIIVFVAALKSSRVEWGSASARFNGSTLNRFNALLILILFPRWRPPPAFRVLRLFGMQIRWPGLRRIFIKKFKKTGSTRQAPWHNVAGACLGFHDRDIWFAGDWEKIIGCGAAHETGCSIMVGQCDLMKCSSIKLQWPNTAANECARFNRRTQGNNADVIAVAVLSSRASSGEISANISGCSSAR